MSFTTLLNRFIVMGHHPDDTDDEKLRKSTLLTMSAPFAVAGLIWGLLYFSNGLVLPGMIPFSYSILSILSILHFAKTTRYKVFRNSQLLLILILPFALQLSLGGFIPSSAVIMWALVSPTGALVFFNKRQSFLWFIAFIFLVALAFIVNDRLPYYFNWHLGESFINALFLMNIIGISSIIFLIQYYFVGRQTELKSALDQKRIELEEQTEKLKGMDQIKSRFFANISHEFRTPLTLILGLLSKQAAHPETPPDLKETNTMQRNARRLLQLINQLLDLSKLESGNLRLVIAQNDIVHFCKTLIAQYESMALDKHIAIRFNGNDINSRIYEEQILLYFDHDKIQKVITNLISNAIKFTPVQGQIQVDIEDADDHIKICIFNSGDGIAKGQMHRIFDRFYQADTGNTRQYEGTGIGLALVKELVEFHKGTVKVESSPGKTLFTVTLPKGLESTHSDLIQNSDVALIEPERIDLEIDAQAIQHVHIGKERESNHELEILVVEDNPDLRMYIKSILNKSYTVTEAVDGVDGLEKALASIPDLIISDVMMPNMDGYELCSKLKSDNHTNHIPVIILTAKASRENKLTGLEIGADDYLVKPFDQEELEVRIRNLIAIRSQLQKKFQQEVWLKPKEIKVSSVHQQFLEQLKEIIEQHIDDSKFNVEDLGAGLAMSRSQVHRKLKALTDQSATTFIRNYRLHRAADLLKQESGTVTEIAYRVGFDSQTYFSTCFQKLFGCAPSAYKKNAENQQRVS